jgi:hypothetical protein
MALEDVGSGISNRIASPDLHSSVLIDVLLLETTLTHIVAVLESDRPLAIVSADRRDQTDQNNLDRTKRLLLPISLYQILQILSVNKRPFYRRSAPPTPKTIYSTTPTN